jgi:hypothetical protein
MFGRKFRFEGLLGKHHEFVRDDEWWIASSRFRVTDKGLERVSPCHPTGAWMGIAGG